MLCIDLWRSISKAPQDFPAVCDTQSLNPEEGIAKFDASMQKLAD
jgi:hypothetical protein